LSQSSICSANLAAIRFKVGNRSQSATDTNVMSPPSGVLPGILYLPVCENLLATATPEGAAADLLRFADWTS
jgi:hypothetical protein